MAKTLDQILEQEKPEIVAEARRKASEILRLLDEQTAKQDNETDSVDSYHQK